MLRGLRREVTLHGWFRRANDEELLQAGPGGLGLPHPFLFIGSSVGKKIVMRQDCLWKGWRNWLRWFQQWAQTAQSLDL